MQTAADVGDERAGAGADTAKFAHCIAQRQHGYGGDQEGPGRPRTHRCHYQTQAEENTLRGSEIGKRTGNGPKEVQCIALQTRLLRSCGSRFCLERSRIHAMVSPCSLKCRLRNHLRIMKRGNK